MTDWLTEYILWLSKYSANESSTFFYCIYCSNTAYRKNWKERKFMKCVWKSVDIRKRSENKRMICGKCMLYLAHTYMIWAFRFRRESFCFCYIRHSLLFVEMWFFFRFFEVIWVQMFISIPIYFFCILICSIFRWNYFSYYYTA